MRFLVLAAASMVWVLKLPASSHVPWMGGTLPYETTPFFELDTRLGYEFSDRSSGGRLELEAGLANKLSLGVVGRAGSESFSSGWVGSNLQSYAHADLALRGRLSEASQWPLDLGAFVGCSLDQFSQEQVLGGVIVAKEIGDHELALNVWYSGFDGTRVRLAWLSAFLFSTCRLGLEVEPASSVYGWRPELRFSFPGDLELQLSGAYSSILGMSSAVLISYQFFQDP